MDIFPSDRLLRALQTVGTSRFAMGHLHHFHLLPEDGDAWWDGAIGGAASPDGGTKAPAGATSDDARADAPASTAAPAASADVSSTSGDGDDAGASSASASASATEPSSPPRDDAPGKDVVPMSPGAPRRRLVGPMSKGRFRCCSCLIGVDMDATDDGIDAGQCRHLWQHIHQEPNILMVMCDQCGRILNGSIHHTTVMKPSEVSGFAPLKLLLMSCGDNYVLKMRALRFMACNVFHDLVTHKGASKWMSVDTSDAEVKELVMDTNAVAMLYGVGYEDTTVTVKGDDGEDITKPVVSLKELTPEILSDITRARDDIGLMAHKVMLQWQEEEGEGAVTEEAVRWIPEDTPGVAALMAVIGGQNVDALVVEDGAGASAASPSDAARMMMGRGGGPSAMSSGAMLERLAAMARARHMVEELDDDDAPPGMRMGHDQMPLTDALEAHDADAGGSDEATIDSSPVERGAEPVPAPRAGADGVETTRSPVGKEEEEDAPGSAATRERATSRGQEAMAAAVRSSGVTQAASSNGGSSTLAERMAEMFGGSDGGDDDVDGAGIGGGGKLYLMRTPTGVKMVMLTAEQEAMLAGGMSRGSSSPPSASARGDSGGTWSGPRIQELSADDVGGDEKKGDDGGSSEIPPIDETVVTEEHVAEQRKAERLRRQSSRRAAKKPAADTATAPTPDAGIPPPAPRSTASSSATSGGDTTASATNGGSAPRNRPRIPSVEDVSRVAASVTDVADCDPDKIPAPPALTKQSSDESFTEALNATSNSGSPQARVLTPSSGAAAALAQAAPLDGGAPTAASTE